MLVIKVVNKTAIILIKCILLHAF